MIPSAEPADELRALAQALGGRPPPCWSAPDLWHDGDPEPAMRACVDLCHALPECAAYATTIRPQHGVWGGVDHQRHGRRKATA